MPHANFKGGFWIIKIWMKWSVLLPILCQKTLEKSSAFLREMKSVIRIKLYERGSIFTLVTKFPAKNGESRPLKNYTSGRQTASHQDKKKVSSKEKPLKRKPKRKKNKSSTLPSGPKSAKQHSVQDSSTVKARQPKLKKKPPAVVARDGARRKEYWNA